MNIFERIYLAIMRKRMIRETKPQLVYYYIIFEGNENKIRKAMKDRYGLENEEHINEVLKDVNLDDYSICIEKDFYEHCPLCNSIVVKKRKRNN